MEGGVSVVQLLSVLGVLWSMSMMSIVFGLQLQATRGRGEQHDEQAAVCYSVWCHFRRAGAKQKSVAHSWS